MKKTKKTLLIALLVSASAIVTLASTNSVAFAEEFAQEEIKNYTEALNTYSNAVAIVKEVEENTQLELDEAKTAAEAFQALEEVLNNNDKKSLKERIPVVNMFFKQEEAEALTEARKNSERELKEAKKAIKVLEKSTKAKDKILEDLNEATVIANERFEIGEQIFITAETHERLRENDENYQAPVISKTRTVSSDFKLKKRKDVIITPIFETPKPQTDFKVEEQPEDQIKEAVFGRPDVNTSKEEVIAVETPAI